MPRDATIRDFNPDEGDLLDISLVEGFFGLTEESMQAILDGSEGNVLDLSLHPAAGFGPISYGTITLEGVYVSDLTVDDFIL